MILARFRTLRGAEQCAPPAVVIANNHAVNDMSADQNKRSYRIDFLVAAALVTTGLVMSGLSLAELRARPPQQMAQATQPLQSTPGAETRPSVPAETTTGTRPSNVPPEPARPDAEAQKSGAQPALPPAPAEKTAEPIKQK
ncbi:hypothetical protein [Bradyrhizobium sp. AUGA SZCCT0177]|uniref:hypothetical protein n=1 Tax=Bradyrhizobium sp. AUGA SZCCT0177 TaxID=2807665 RepID=UPI0032DF12B5